MQVDTHNERLLAQAEVKKPLPVEQPGSIRPVGGQHAQKSVSSSSNPEAAVVQKDALVRDEGEARLTGRDVEEAVQRLSDYVQNAKRDLLFSVDEDTGRTVIQVLDSETKEVVRQIPPEEILALARRMSDISEEKGGLLTLQV